MKLKERICHELEKKEYAAVNCGDCYEISLADYYGHSTNRANCWMQMHYLINSIEEKIMESLKISDLEKDDAMDIMDNLIVVTMPE